MADYGHWQTITATGGNGRDFSRRSETIALIRSPLFGWRNERCR
jgi:hypothetical protein